jgi:hypothetical protein
MTKKIAISLPDVTLDKARTAVKRRKATSLSGYIVRLIEDASANETFDQMLAEWVRRHSGGGKGIAPGFRTSGSDAPKATT